MGPWDIMSQHFSKYREPPPGISSFTKIRLGWITLDQVILVRPGETRHSFLSPLSRGGKTLAMKVPLADGRYYLIENRQPVGHDKALPDSGILILKVDPDALEGTGTVRVMDADPEAYHFSKATFRLDRKNRYLFQDDANNLAVIPLWMEEGRQGVLLTDAEQSTEALNAALMVRRLLRAFPEPRSKNEMGSIKTCADLFKVHDFDRCAKCVSDILETLD
jgi:hypothetical protein